MKALKLTFVCLFALNALFAQQFNFKKYSVGEGLPQSQVFSILEDSRGYIWMGTMGGGLAKFDGNKFTCFTTKDLLPSNYIYTLLEDEEKNLWIGTRNGLCRFDGNKFITVGSIKEPMAISSLAQDTDGKIWVGTNRGLYQVEDTTLIKRTFKLKIKPPINDILPDKEGNIWIASDGGLFRLDGGSKLMSFLDKGIESKLITSVVQSPQGQIWVSTYQAGVYLFTGEAFEKIGNEQLDDMLIKSLSAMKDGSLWISTNDHGVGVLSSSDSIVSFINDEDGLSNNNVRTVLEDGWGDIWIGTSGGGVCKYLGKQFEHYNRRNGLPADYIFAAYNDSKDRLWCGTSGRGVCRLDSGKFITIRLKPEGEDVKVKAIFETEDSLTWLGSEGQGVFLLWQDSSGRDTVVNYQIKDGLSGNWIRDFAVDLGGNLWVATTEGGLTRVEKDTIGFNFIRLRVSEGLAQNRINKIHVDHQNRLWYATASNGLGCVINDSTFLHFTEADGLSGKAVRTITEDNFGHLWIGLVGSGINRLSIYEDTTGIKQFNYESGLFSDNIYLLKVDVDNNLWVGTEKGLDRIKLSIEGNFLDIKHFGKEEGFIGIETNQNAVTRDNLGNLWFGTVQGLTKYLPGTDVRNGKAPMINIWQTSIQYKPASAAGYGDYVGKWGSLKGSPELPYENNRISFDFVGINQPAPDRVKYQWILEGHENAWSPVVSQTNASYSNLQPGAYTFKVKAVNEDGVWSNPVQASFSIATPYWMEWWFLALCIAGGVLFIATIVLLWMWRIKRNANRKNRQLKMEKRVLSLEQKALRLQMNPHFIFNALNSIQGMIIKKDEAEARKYLGKFSKLMRQTLENSRSETITLEDEITTLTNYLTIEQMSSGNGFEFEISVGEELETELIRIPPMVLQPFVENAIKHGVINLKDRTGKIEVSFEEKSQDVVICKVKDNGVGREEANRLKEQHPEQHRSTGLEVTMARLAHINNTTIKESVSINDVISDSGELEGTEVKVRLMVRG